jgi:UDP-glucose 4-epimerase
MIRFFVTGGAGFIASNLVDRLFDAGHSVIAYDNLSIGIPQFLAAACQHPSFSFVEGDLLDPARLTEALAGHDFVFHLAANADVRFGTEHPRKDLEQNTIATFGWICEHLGINPERRYTGGERGWIGDSPFIFLDATKLHSLGWRPKLSIREGVIRTLEYLQTNQ